MKSQTIIDERSPLHGEGITWNLLRSGHNPLFPLRQQSMQDCYMSLS